MSNAANNNETNARDTSDRRIRYLMSVGEDKRNTVAWRDAIHERQLLDFERGVGK